MKYQIVNRPGVKVDIINAVDYYKTISPELASQFLLRILEAKDQIARYPQSFEIKYKNVRTLLLKQFPFHIHYLIDELHQQIIILSVIHAYKNPMDYLNR
jgi:plasmid stabilization system protein ParE